MSLLLNSAIASGTTPAANADTADLCSPFVAEQNPLIAPLQQSTQIAFVDSALDNIETLIASLGEATVYIVEAGQSGTAYIADVLSQYSAEQIGGVHIFAHGQAGSMQLGSTTLDADALTGALGDDLAAWSQSQTRDVLLYGCNIAAGEAGNDFIAQLAAMTGADILASTDLTGHAALGGDWELEAVVGDVETALVISETGQASYQGTLALAIAGGTGNQPLNVTVDEGTSFVRDLNVTGAAGGFTEGNGVEYYFFGGNDSYLFDLDQNTGVLSFTDVPDYETPADANRDNLYDVRVLAIDYTGQSVARSLNIKVQDIVESGSAPTILTGDGNAYTTVSVEAGQQTVIDLEATDADGDTEGSGLTYSIRGGIDARFFNLDRDTGVLSFKTPRDFDNPADAGGDNIYGIEYQVTDSSGQADSQFIDVRVTQPTEPQNPVITSDGGEDTAVITIDENTTAVTDVVTTGANGFSEGNGLTYSINAGDDADLFDIDPVTGVIAFKSAPDFENPEDRDRNNVYFINVLVQDPNQNADSQFLSIVVRNIVEGGSAPVITSNGGGDFTLAKVQEGTSQAVDVEVTDADGDTEGNGITYRINDGADASRFTIDENTGVVQFNTIPDFENPLDADGNNIYEINVLATDSAGKVDSQFIQIEVTNLVSVYLLGGQSNMAGDTSDADDLVGRPEANPLSSVQIWQPGVNSFIDLRPGFNSNFGAGAGFGAELGFGHTLAAAQANGTADGEEIYIVKYAIGATSLADDWDPNGGPIYNQFNNWVGGALASLTNAGIDYTIEAMLWMQGENDANDVTRAANYQTNLTNFISDMRSRYNSDMDFVIGRLHEELPAGFYLAADTVRAAQVDVGNAADNNYWIDTDGLPVNPVDSVHFDSFGHLALGEAFADIFIS